MGALVNIVANGMAGNLMQKSTPSVLVWRVLN
jgi:hypothetical protein